MEDTKEWVAPGSNKTLACSFCMFIVPVIKFKCIKIKIKNKARILKVYLSLQHLRLVPHHGSQRKLDPGLSQLVQVPVQESVAEVCLYQLLLCLPIDLPVLSSVKLVLRSAAYPSVDMY